MKLPCHSCYITQNVTISSGSFRRGEGTGFLSLVTQNLSPLCFNYVYARHIVSTFLIEVISLFIFIYHFFLDNDFILIRDIHRCNKTRARLYSLKGGFMIVFLRDQSIVSKYANSLFKILNNICTCNQDMFELLMSDIHSTFLTLTRCLTIEID